MTSGSDAATPLFHRLIKKDLQSLRFNLEKTLDNEATKKRLFHQIKENQLDEYWLNVEPIVYLEIRRFNKKIQESVWENNT